MFTSITAEEELSLLETDTAIFDNTIHYLEPLIQDALDKFVLSPEQRSELYKLLREDIATAARRFLLHRASKVTYRFSTYFNWYIAQRINPLNPERRT